MPKIDSLTSTSSYEDKAITEFRSDIFDQYPNSRFATGLIANGTRPVEGLEDTFRAYATLRARTYIDEEKYLPEEVRLQDGTELDEDDARSTHFAVIENMGDYQKVVATMRVIHGGSLGRLPIEEYFPDFPYSTNHSGKAIEISRFISRHEDKQIKQQLKWNLFTSVLSYVMHSKLGPTYAVVDKRLEEGLSISGVPVQRIAEPIFVHKYNSHNVGILIDTQGLSRRIEADTPGALAAMDFSRLGFSGTTDTTN